MRGPTGQATAADLNKDPLPPGRAGILCKISGLEDRKPHPALANRAPERVEGPPDQSELFGALKPLHDSRPRRSNQRTNSYLGEWCNGSTTDSDSVCLGSNPSSPASLACPLISDPVQQSQPRQTADWAKTHLAPWPPRSPLSCYRGHAQARPRCTPDTRTRSTQPIQISHSKQVNFGNGHLAALRADPVASPRMTPTQTFAFSRHARVLPEISCPAVTKALPHRGPTSLSDYPHRSCERPSRRRGSSTFLDQIPGVGEGRLSDTSRSPRSRCA